MVLRIITFLVTSFLACPSMAASPSVDSHGLPNPDAKRRQVRKGCHVPGGQHLSPPSDIEKKRLTDKAPTVFKDDGIGGLLWPKVHQEALQELIDGYVPLPTLFMNEKLHFHLAHSARAGFPLALLYLSKLFKHFEVFPKEQAEFLKRSKESLRAIANDDSRLPYLRGKAFQYLKDEGTAEKMFQKAAGKHPYAAYELGRILASNGEYDKAIELFKDCAAKAPESFLELGYYEEDDTDRFKAFKEAGDRGISEGYYEISKMVKEGFPGAGRTKWLRKAADAHNTNAILALAKKYESEKTYGGAIKLYQTLSKKGNLRGFLEHGRILENDGKYDEARKQYKKALWFGFYELARLEPKKDVADKLRDHAQKAFATHFDKLLEISS